ncbi:hypothetical protein CLF_103285 [Clonorchis sinensis]|uniref:ZSWIM1/3 RNaseH-like domain-containing protein n=1 Tax=Clonorchis sinensis TaxID=79923 RepID=G7Y9H2_CLOSI|nr:hypothetical protein CLF_103285 [Clonorchis sinensis]
MPSVLAKFWETRRLFVWHSEEGHVLLLMVRIALIRRFPDAANRFGYKLYAFLITDGMGTGRPVMYAFVRSEQFAPMRKLFDLFKETIGRFQQHLQLLRRTDPRVVSFLLARLLSIARKWTVHAVRKGLLWHCHQQSSREWNGRLKDRVYHADTLERAIEKVARHAEWFMQGFELHTSYHCDGRQLLEGDGYVLNVFSRMTTYACPLVLRHFRPRLSRLPYDSVGTNKVGSSYYN